MIMVPEPYFNEPGHERDMSTSSGKSRSNAYNIDVRQNTIKLAVLENLRKPPKDMERFIITHFYFQYDFLSSIFVSSKSGLSE